MEPDLVDIGSNLEDTMKYQTVHEELISKLKVKNCDNLLPFFIILIINTT